MLNGASLTTRHAIELVRAVAGGRAASIRVPRAAATGAGAAAGWIASIARRDLPFCSELARTLLHGHRYDGSQATRELGLTYRTIEDTVARTLGWYAEHGLSEPSSAYHDVPADIAEPHPVHPTRRHTEAPVTSETPRPDRNLALELVRVTEAAALAAGGGSATATRSRPTPPPSTRCA